MKNRNLLSSFTNEASCPQLSYEDNPSMNRISCSTHADFSFVRCIFFGHPTNPTADIGGAICIINEGSSLTVESCKFGSLIASTSAGAIYTKDVSPVSFKHSLFDRCSSPTDLTGSSGAIKIADSTQPLIQNCLFTSCTTFGDGGAVYLSRGRCSSNNGIAVQNSRFVSCKCTGETTGDGADGGGLMTWANEQLLGIRNCLFSHCYCYKGAGVCLYVPDDSSLTHFKFGFFIKNAGSFGNDVFVNVAYGSGWGSVFSHTCTTGAVHPLGDNYLSPEHVENNWFPQTHINT